MSDCLQIIAEKYGSVFKEYDNGKVKVWSVDRYKIQTNEYENYSGKKGTLVIYNDTIMENRVRAFRQGRKQDFD